MTVFIYVMVASCLEQQRNQKQGEQKDDGVHL